MAGGLFLPRVERWRSARKGSTIDTRSLFDGGEDLADIDRIVPPGAVSGTRYPIGQMHRLNV